MDYSLFQQFEFVGLVTYQVQNLKRPKELCLQLPIAFGFDIFAVQPNLLAGSITSRLNFFIVSLFLQFLGVLQVFSTYSHKIPKFFGQLISCFRPGVGVEVLSIGNTWVVPVVELKRRVLCTGIFCIIISKFCHWQKPRPVVLFVINKGSKISFYHAILLLHLAVSLRVEDGRESLFNAQKVAQRRPKCRHKY